MASRAPLVDYLTPFEDSRRWARFEPRVGDIVIATPPKSGTTWTQGIVRSLLWPAGDHPDSIGRLSPWVDSRVGDIEEVVERLAGQLHRRFVKTHSPADAIPIDDRCRYVCIYRAGPDALVSWGNHRRHMRPAAGEALNERSAADGIAPIPTVWDDDWDYLFSEWINYCSPIRLLQGWWPLRGRPNVRFLHYADLTADLDGEMRALADWLGIDVPAAAWPEVVARCRLDAMRAAAEAAGGMDRGFEGGASSFFYRGGNGRGRELLDDAFLERFAEAADAGLPADAVAWLAAGAPSGVRPNDPLSGSTSVSGSGSGSQTIENQEVSDG